MKKNYTLLSCIESKMIHPTQLYGRFELGQFATGQAVTVANTLRRALLSQLPGVAITLVHITNVSHEYESVPGIQEPVLDILSNLKKIVFTSEFEVFQPQIGYLHLKGPAVVRAGDLKLPFFISCVHPEQYITTLSEHGDFCLTVLINSGKQYLNHTPDSPAYNTRVARLQQHKLMVKAPTFTKQRRRFYLTWQQQRNIAKPERFAQIADFVKSKLAQKLWKQQQMSRQQQFVRKARSRLIKDPFYYRLYKTNDFKSRLNYLTKSDVSRRHKWAPFWFKLEQTRSEESLVAEALLKNFKSDYKKEKKEFRNFIEARNQFLNTKGYLPVNAFFSPVTKVNYTIQVEENRIGETVCFEVWTNGSIDPRRAIHRSVKALIKLFLPFQLVERENKQLKPVHPKLKHRRERRIRQAEFKKRVEQSVVSVKSLPNSAHNPPIEPRSANAFLQQFKKKAVVKPPRRKYPKNRFPSEWPQHQQRRRAPLYTYVQPIATNTCLNTFVKQRQLLRTFRMFFPLFNIADRFSDSYGLTSNQYTKLSRLNILNLELPFVIYKFLWKHKVQNIGDLFFIHYQMINKSVPVKKKVLFYRAFQEAFAKLFYQWTGNTETKAKILTERKYKKQMEEQQAKEQQAKEREKTKKKRQKRSRRKTVKRSRPKNDNRNQD
jgi:DNA-directed RNA polymerase alpha subunit